MMPGRRLLIALLAALALTAVGSPSPAAGHGVIGRSQDTLFYTSPDPGLKAHLLIFSRTRGTVDLLDPGSGHIDSGPCVSVTERRVRCSTRGLRRIRVEVHDDADFVRSSAAVPLSVSGGVGADVIHGGYGDDVLDGGPGPDEIWGGLGADRADGSEGDDVLRLRDGVADKVRCEGGEDQAVLDESDIAGLAQFLDCETRSTAAAPADERAPRVFIRARERQELDRSGVTVGVAMSEPGTIRTFARLYIGGRRGPHVESVISRPNAPRQRWALQIKLGSDAHWEARSALDDGFPVTMGIWARGTDAAGNDGRETARVKLIR